MPVPGGKQRESDEMAASAALARFAWKAAPPESGQPIDALPGTWIGSPRPEGAADPIPGERRKDYSMATYVITHEVDDVEHWLSSPKREEVFGPIGVTVRTFRDPEGSNKTALIAEIPDMQAFQELMNSDAAADAMKYDGVHPDTLLVLSEGS
jgi:hypothetical protein